MSLSILTQGGAGGESASIFVTGLNETDSVKAVLQIPKQELNPEYVGLPDEYMQLAYIESTGTQYINTNYKPNTNTKLEIGAYTNDTTNDKPLFGVRKAQGSESFLCWFNPGEDRMPGFAVGSTTNTYTYFGIATGTLHHVSLSNSEFSMDGQIYTIDPQTFTATYNLYLLGLNLADTADERKFYGRLYYAKLYEANTLQHNYIPAQRISDNVLGMYDTVTNTFLTNAGTGSFIAGDEITQYITIYDDGKTVSSKWIEKNNDIVVSDDYIQLEYLESNGNELINTEYLVTNNTKVEFKIMTLANQPQAYPSLFGVQETASGGNRFGVNMSWAARTGSTSFGPNTNLFNVAREGSLENGVFILDGTTYTSTESFTPLDIPMYLFSNNDLENQPTRAALNSASRFYYFKIYEGDTLVKYFVPAKRKSDNVLGMYDAINNTFYTNAGTGSFTAGTETPSIIYGHFISPIKSYGTWAVTATNGEKTATQDVLVDVAVDYNIEMFYDFYTEFDKKGADWVEDGGTFTFNPATEAYPGLYQAEGSRNIGTLTVFDNAEWNGAKTLTIPLNGALETFHAETVYYWGSSNANRLGRIMVAFQDEIGNNLFYINMGDGWLYSNSIGISYVNVLTDSPLVFANDVAASPYCNVPLHFTLDYDGSTMNVGFSRNNESFTYKTETYAFPPISKVMILFTSINNEYTNLLNVRSLTVEQA